jgi:hypothetical protein
VAVASAAATAGGQQTTWQKLSARIKALEWNVTMSSGFLEELSTKYIQQIEEMKLALKVRALGLGGVLRLMRQAASEGVGAMVRREEAAREREAARAAQVGRMYFSFVLVLGLALGGLGAIQAGPPDDSPYRRGCLAARPGGARRGGAGGQARPAAPARGIKHRGQRPKYCICIWVFVDRNNL